MLFVLSHLMFLVAWALACRVSGGVVLARLGIDPDDPIERSSIAALVGIGVVGQLVFVLGLAGWLRPLPIFGALALATTLAVGLDRSARRGLIADLSALLRLGGARWMAALVWLVPVVLLALYPPTGFDAGTYHLPFAERFIEAGELVRVDALRFPIFPQLTEMGFVVAMLAVGDVGCRLIQIVPLVAVAGLLVALGRRRGQPRVGVWAAAFWLGTPLALRIATQAYVDVTLAAFVGLGVIATERWWRDDDRRWLAVGAGALGFGVATKYLALFFLAGLGVLALIRAVTSRDLRPFVVSGLALAITAGPWIGRLVIETGSPVFPFYSGIFGESDWMPIYERHPEVAAPFVERWGERLAFIAKTPWAMLFDRQVFGLQAPLSPWLLLLPIVGLVAWMTRRPGAWAHTAFVVGYVLFWVCGEYRDLRFLLPAMPSIAWCVARGLDELVERVGKATPGSGLVLALILILVVPGWAYAVKEVVERGAVPTTTAERQAFLERRLGGYRLLGQALEAVDGTIYGLHTEHLIYHGHGRLIGDWMGPHRFETVYAAIGDKEPATALATVLRSMGADALLVRLDGVVGPWPLAPNAEHQCFEPLAQDEHTTGERFVLFALTPGCS